MFESSVSLFLWWRDEQNLLYHCNYFILIRCSWNLVQLCKNSWKLRLVCSYAIHFKLTCSFVSCILMQHKWHILFSAQYSVPDCLKPAFGYLTFIIEPYSIKCPFHMCSLYVKAHHAFCEELLWTLHTLWNMVINEQFL